ncbi:hypothetical protein AK812_SmicGene27456 [Symbiodinium microadriaticum]|uniref:Uncharacterized protein n=1 Tax=Symbiodinium microadriaticum TaxID=2951 RepID=A0A1Q9D6U8_SYMMI|nr:hypothetical protein AK812_SmicGene27456 [Symbiodinium microadriaticum]
MAAPATPAEAWTVVEGIVDNITRDDVFARLEEMQKTVARLNLGEDEDTAHADQVMSGRTRLGIVARPDLSCLGSVAQDFGVKGMSPFADLALAALIKADQVHLRAAGDWLDAAGSSGSSARERPDEETERLILKADVTEECFVNKVGTYGMASAQLYGGKVFTPKDIEKGLGETGRITVDPGEEANQISMEQAQWGNDRTADVNMWGPLFGLFLSALGMVWQFTKRIPAQRIFDYGITDEAVEDNSPGSLLAMDTMTMPLKLFLANLSSGKADIRGLGGHCHLGMASALLLQAHQELQNNDVATKVAWLVGLANQLLAPLAQANVSVPVGVWPVEELSAMVSGLMERANQEQSAWLLVAADTWRQAASPSVYVFLSVLSWFLLKLGMYALDNAGQDCHNPNMCRQASKSTNWRRDRSSTM